MSKTIPHHVALQTVHIDRIDIGGRIAHHPIGNLFYAMYDGEPVAVGASAFKPQRKKNAEDVYIRSRHIEGHDELATWLEFNCCPPQILQGHNVWGHGDMQDYVTAIFERIVGKFPQKLQPTERERQLWHGGDVEVNHVHLAANFVMPESLKLPLTDAVDHNNPQGKKRDHLTAISLGFNGDRRSEYQAASMYDKAAELLLKWKDAGFYRLKIIGMMRGAMRFEVKLFRRALKLLGLTRVKDWAGVDVTALFFEFLTKFDIANSIQPLLTEDERKMLTKKELAAYILWLEGHQLSDFHGRTTVWKYVKAVKDKVGIDMGAHRRPDKLPVLNIPELLVPSNIVPVPDWLPNIPGQRYWVPGTAAEEFAVKQAALASTPAEPAPKLREMPDDDELDAIAY